MTAIEKITMLDSTWVTDRGTSYWWNTKNPPARAAMKPDRAKAEIFARIGLTPNDCAARWLSRVATRTRPLRELRSDRTDPTTRTNARSNV